MSAFAPLGVLRFLRGTFATAVTTALLFFAGCFAARFAAFWEANLLNGVEPPVLLRAVCCRYKITDTRRGVSEASKTAAAERENRTST